MAVFRGSRGLIWPILTAIWGFAGLIRPILAAFEGSRGQIWPILSHFQRIWLVLALLSPGLIWSIMAAFGGWGPGMIWPILGPFCGLILIKLRWRKGLIITVFFRFLQYINSTSSEKLPSLPF